jgi:DNA-binding MarR family transcriptional regulator/GNAT superfamily N-acetyltransferase
MATSDRVATVRAFNRFYTSRIGALRGGLLHTRHPLPEARVIYELAQRERTEAADLLRTLDLEAGDLERLLARLEAQGLVVREPGALRLTAHGAAAYAALDARSAEENAELLAGLAEAEQRRLVDAMQAIRRLLEPLPRPAPFLLREPRSGDFGWVVQRHGALYAEEYSWDETFEALVAEIVAAYVQHRDGAREAAWIAEVGGEPAGCVFCVRKDDRTAQLRLLLVEPSARGMGVGASLVDACLRFAREAGYERIVLWTNDVLHDARRIYERAGFALVDAEPHHSFGHDLVGQHWARALTR